MNSRYPKLLSLFWYNITIIRLKILKINKHLGKLKVSGFSELKVNSTSRSLSFNQGHDTWPVKYSDSRLYYKVHNAASFIGLSKFVKRLLLQPEIMTESDIIIKPPKHVRGMKHLDEAQFATTIKVPTMKVPKQQTNIIIKHVKKYILKLQKIKQVVDLADEDSSKLTHKLILMDPRKVFIRENVFIFANDEGDFIMSFGNDICNVYYVDIDVAFENWTTSDILDAVLPDDSNISAFETVGHIAHLNLRDHLLDYKYIIGEVILAKTPTVKTVVNKVNTIDNTYRNFAMELVAGVEEYITVHRENGCSYEMDYSKIYWNSRLSTEHQRLVSNIDTDAVVYDVFAGVGPFSIPAAKQGCVCHTNDLNPESHRWLQRNVALNKVGNAVTAYNLDGREFIRTVVKSDLLSRWKDQGDELERSRAVCVIMNLPALAVEFLDTFRGLFTPQDVVPHPVVLPTIHCYCFAACDGAPLEDISARISVAMGTAPCDVVYKLVRHVAPNKDMYCVQFTVARDVLLCAESSCPHDGEDEHTVREPESKRLKVDQDSQSREVTELL